MNRQRPGPARARKGETLAEVLVALLIATLATLLLAAMVTASARVNIAARLKDEEFFQVLTQVEAQDGTIKSTENHTVQAYSFDPATGTVGSTPTDISNQVYVYSPDDGQLAFYGLDD